MKLAVKINSARKELCGVELKKSQNAGRYNYMGLEDFLPQCLALCDKYGFLPVTSFTTDMATMTVYDTESDETLTITSPMSDAKIMNCQPVQCLGGVQTYLRRYLWNCLFELVEHDALEEQSGHGGYEEKPQKEVRETVNTVSSYSSQKAWSTFVAKYGYKKGGDEETNKNAISMAKTILADNFGVTDLSQFSEEVFKKAMDFVSGPEGFVEEINF